jgi:hypothetical protein
MGGSKMGGCICVSHVDAHRARNAAVKSKERSVPVVENQPSNARVSQKTNNAVAIF